ncbi:GIY-YIG nuclease family protein [Methylocystis sp. JAN1]|uniref:GIY-YIG nuclease family protein n=1 Tax=Methylocystis sp. JAN1 TaxID=3397211 RepID=UPI003FA1BBDE
MRLSETPRMDFIASADRAPPCPGAYALWLRLAAPLAVRAGANFGALGAGDYLYCGSANGPGGLRARLARHMRKDRRAHWHVDQLTAEGAVIGAFIVEGGSECALNAALSDLPAPLPGFGSSDCPRCVSHLRYFPRLARLPYDWENARKAAKFIPPPPQMEGD